VKRRSHCNHGFHDYGRSHCHNGFQMVNRSHQYLGFQIQPRTSLMRVSVAPAFQ
jgi:hypothetical protein